MGFRIEKNMNINFSNLSPIQWSVLVFFGLLGLVCLFIMAWQFRPSAIPSDNKRRLYRSLIVGVLAGIFSASILLMGGVFLWNDSNKFISIFGAILPMLCIVPFVILITIGSSYLQYWYTSRMKKYISDVGVDVSKRQKNNRP
jgi:hypothetical protein